MKGPMRLFIQLFATYETFSRFQFCWKKKPKGTKRIKVCVRILLEQSFREFKEKKV